MTLLLLSNIKWEVAYSTLCTEKFRKLYINLHMAGLLFRKHELRHNSHMLQHTPTQAHINKVGEKLTIAAAILPTAVGSSRLKVRVPARCLHFVILRDVIKQKI